jgi:hypothetical protein
MRTTGISSIRETTSCPSTSDQRAPDFTIHLLGKSTQNKESAYGKLLPWKIISSPDGANKVTVFQKQELTA